jgi:hypothetical protein
MPTGRAKAWMGSDGDEKRLVGSVVQSDEAAAESSASVSRCLTVAEVAQSQVVKRLVHLDTHMKVNVTHSQVKFYANLTSMTSPRRKHEVTFTCYQWIDQYEDYSQMEQDRYTHLYISNSTRFETKAILDCHHLPIFTYYSSKKFRYY